MYKVSLNCFFMLFGLVCFASLRGQERTVQASFIKTDSLISQKIEEISLGNYKGYIFPKEYGKIYYRIEIEKGEVREVVDLDPILIVLIDAKLDENEYINANREFMKHRYNEFYMAKKEMPDAYDWEKLKKGEEEYWKSFEENKKVWSKLVNSWDRQFIGFVNAKGETVVLINLIDFSNDPYCMKQYVNKQIISGFHGWFYSNIRRLYYNLSQQKFSLFESP